MAVRIVSEQSYKGGSELKYQDLEKSRRNHETELYRKQYRKAMVTQKFKNRFRTGLMVMIEKQKPTVYVTPVFLDRKVYSDGMTNVLRLDEGNGAMKIMGKEVKYEK